MLLAKGMIQEQSEECIKRKKKTVPSHGCSTAFFKNNSKTEKEPAHMCDLNCVHVCARVEKGSEALTGFLTPSLREVGLRPE